VGRHTNPVSSPGKYVLCGCIYEYIRHTLLLLGVCVVMYLTLTGSSLAVELSCCDCVEINVSKWRKCAFPPPGLEPMSCISVALMAQYLNVRQRKLGTIIIQTVRIQQHDSADTGSMPTKDFLKHNPSYFQITQPGSSTITSPYQLGFIVYGRLAWRKELRKRPVRLLVISESCK
jgi:hypothetical protein